MSAAGSRRPSSSGRFARSRSTSLRRRCARRGRGSIFPSRSRFSRRRGRCRPTVWRRTPRSASSRSTDASARSAACSPSPRRRAARVSSACSARPSRPPRRRSPGSSRSLSGISPRRRRTSVANRSRRRSRRRENGQRPAYPDLADVRGQERARRALELAAAGGHNLLLAGPPGTGKTMLARRLPGVLPPLEPEESLEVTRIHSVAGLLAREHPLIRHPPFRAPHHSASMVALVGGGRLALPGEVSLAHPSIRVCSLNDSCWHLCPDLV